MDLIDFIHISNRAESMEDLKEALYQLILTFGYEMYLVTEFSRDRSDSSDEFSGKILSYPPGWVDQYTENFSAEVLRIYRKTLSTSEPFTWKYSDNNTISSEDGRTKDVSGDTQLIGGIAFSLHQPLGRIIGFGFTSRKKRFLKDDDTRSILKAAAQQFVSVRKKIQPQFQQDGGDIEITRREKEVLSWVTHGKTKSEVAEIMGISESSVKRYCEILSKKFGTNNLVATVAKALQMGIVTPL